MMMTNYPSDPLTQRAVPGLNILGTPTCCVHASLELLQIPLQSVNIVLGSFLESSLLVYVEIIQSNQEIIYCITVNSIESIGILKGIHIKDIITFLEVNSGVFSFHEDIT